MWSWLRNKGQDWLVYWGVMKTYSQQEQWHRYTYFFFKHRNNLQKDVSFEQGHRRIPPSIIEDVRQHNYLTTACERNNSAIKVTLDVQCGEENKQNWGSVETTACLTTGQLKIFCPSIGGDLWLFTLALLLHHIGREIRVLQKPQGEDSFHCWVRSNITRCHLISQMPEEHSYI